MTLHAEYSRILSKLRVSGGFPISANTIFNGTLSCLDVEDLTYADVEIRKRRCSFRQKRCEAKTSGSRAFASGIGDKWCDFVDPSISSVCVSLKRVIPTTAWPRTTSASRKTWGTSFHRILKSFCKATGNRARHSESVSWDDRYRLIHESPTASRLQAS